MTNLSRRDLARWLPVLAAGGATRPAAAAPLMSHVYHSEQIPYQGDEKKKAREFFHGTEHSGFDLEMHETILGPGTETHAPHKHEHEEIIIVMSGSVDAWIEGKTETAEAGSVIFFGSNQMHTSRNAGAIPCRYCVIELRGKPA